MSIAPPNHTRRKGVTTDSWVTPKWLIDRLGPFDLDPCACNPMPWRTASIMITEQEDGLLCQWRGFVWLNPPYGRSIDVWMERMSIHNHGIALIFARTETRFFHDHVWPVASCLLFFKGRLVFYLPSGALPHAGNNSGGPSVLVGYGGEAKNRLEQFRDMGAYVAMK